MIGQKFNFDDVFFRDLTVCVLDTLEGRLNWINRFSSGDVSVSVPIYYSMTGDDRFLLDAFQDDIVSENRYVELNTDQIPRGHLTLTNFNIRSDEFRNPNVWLRSVVEDDTEVKKLLKQVRAIPITATYDLTILLKNEIDIFKCSQEIMNTLWLYKFMYFEYNYMNIDAIMLMPDTETIQIQREKNLKSDDIVKLTLSIEVQTYYPSFVTSNQDKVRSTVVRTCSYSNLKLNSTDGISVGQYIIGQGIGQGVTVTSIDYDNRYISTSSTITDTYSGQSVSFSNNINDVQISTNYYVDSVLSSNIRLNSVVNIQVGCAVTSENSSTFVPDSVVVVSINELNNSIVLNKNISFIQNQNILICGNSYNVICGNNIIYLTTTKDIQVGQQVSGQTIGQTIAGQSIADQTMPGQSIAGQNIGQPIAGQSITLSTKVIEVNEAENYVICSKPINVIPKQTLFFSFNNNLIDSIVPYKTRWFSNLYTNGNKKRNSLNPNAVLNNNNPNFNSR